MNKSVLLGLNIVLLLLVGVLFYLHFNLKNECSSPSGKPASANAVPGQQLIAYFEMDSVENNYEYLKDVKNELKAQEDGMNKQLNNLKNQYIDKVNKFQQEAQNMSQERQGAMQQDLMQQQKYIQNKEQALGLEFQDASFKKMQEVNKTIEEFLVEYNKDKGYAYIIAHQPGLVYYKNPAFDITGPILKELNARYKKKK